MQKASFVRTDFQRSIKPQLAPCLGRLFQQSAGSAATLVSSARVPFPHVGAVSAMFRITAAVTSGGQTANVVIDSVFLGQSRTEYSLTVVAPEVAKSQLVQFETRLARALVARTKA